jgi:hypothetical protein
MKRSVMAVLAGLCLAGFTAAASGQVVISQVYGGGGNAGSTYTHDFVELYNKGAAPVDLTGWSIQYASAGGFTWTVNSLSGIIQPGGYFLIQEGQGAGGTTPLPTPDLIATPAIAMSSTGAKVALVNTTTAFTTACPLPDASIIDFVGYSASATCFEGTAPTVAPGGNANSMQRVSNGCQDTNNNFSDFQALAAAPRNSATTTFTCPNDCNNNGIADNIDIANNPALDCNTNTIIDSCEIAANPALDCNGNSTLDSCDAVANPALDCNANAQLDSCEIAANAALDCNLNSTLDSCDVIANPALDCNGNGVIDCTDYRLGTLTDSNANGTADDCEGASVVTCAVNATVNPTGTRAAPGGTGNFNIEGSLLGTFASYGGLRWNVTDITAEFDTAFGAGAWEVSRAYLHMHQDNAAFTVNGSVEIVHTNNDTIDFSAGNLTTQYGNYATDYTDTAQILSYAFNQGTINSDGDGTIETHLLYDADAANNPGAAAVGAELNSASGAVTLLVHEIDPFVAATYAGRTNGNQKGPFRGPTLVVFARATSTCGSADFDGDGDTGTDADIEAFFACLGGNCCGTCGTADFDGDGDTGTDADIEAFFRVLGGGNC